MNILIPRKDVKNSFCLLENLQCTMRWGDLASAAVTSTKKMKEFFTSRNVPSGTLLQWI